MGGIIMEFVVDTLGRAIPSTVRDVRSDEEQPLTGREHGVYGQLVEAGRRAIVSGRFTPAVIAGCTVNQRVRQPFEFKLGDGFASP